MFWRYVPEYADEYLSMMDDTECIEDDTEELSSYDGLITLEITIFVPREDSFFRKIHNRFIRCMARIYIEKLSDDFWSLCYFGAFFGVFG